MRDGKRKQHGANQAEALNLIAKTAPTVLFSCRWDGYMEYVNKAFYDYSGLPEGAALGHGWLSSIHPDDLQKIRESMLRATRTLSPPEAVEHRIRMADGSWRWFIGRPRAVHGEDGRIARWVGSCADIEDRKRAEQELNESRQRFKLALRASAAGVWEWDLATGEVRWSDECYEVMGVPKSTPPSYEAWLATIDEKQRAATETTVRKKLAEKTEFEIEYRSVLPGGGVRWITSRGSPILDENGEAKRVMGIVLDITERKRTEEELREQQQAIRKLSTPVLEVSSRLLIVPLIGAVDPVRAQQLTEQLLHAIRARRARAVVVDITGVHQMDEAAANHLLQTGEAARLLGAEFIVSGISRPIAQSLVNLGVDLSRLVTVGDLRSGIERATAITHNAGFDKAA